MRHAFVVGNPSFLSALFTGQEHMEPTMFPWCIAEYKAIANTVGPGNFYLTSLPLCIPSELKDFSNVLCKSVTFLSQFSHDRICLLDPKAEQVLSPTDAHLFDCFLFGGILGDDPPRDRTAELRALGFFSRNLGDTQMTTDTAVSVTKIIIKDQLPIDKIPFVDFPELRFSKHEAVEMPFRYIKKLDGEPLLPEGMKELIREEADSSLDIN